MHVSGYRFAKEVEYTVGFFPVKCNYIFLNVTCRIRVEDEGDHLSRNQEYGMI